MFWLGLLIGFFLGLLGASLLAQSRVNGIEMDYDEQLQLHVKQHEEHIEGFRAKILKLEDR